MGKKAVKKKTKKKNLLFVISRSGKSAPHISFYEGKRFVPKEKINVVFKSADTGRFITRTLSPAVFHKSERGVVRERTNVAFKRAAGGTFRTQMMGRNASSGQFVTTREARVHPRRMPTERVPKVGYGDSIKGSLRKERVDTTAPVYFRKK